MRIKTYRVKQEGNKKGTEGVVTFEGLHVIGPDFEPFLLLRASDVVAFDVLTGYKNAVMNKRAAPSVIARFQKLQAEFATWAAKHGSWPLFNEEAKITEVDLGDLKQAERTGRSADAAGNVGSGTGPASGSEASESGSDGELGADGAGSKKGADEGYPQDGGGASGNGSGALRPVAGKTQKRKPSTGKKKSTKRKSRK